MMIATNDSAGSGAQPWRLAMWGAIGLLLLLPLVAMQFTSEVTWDATDFAAAATLLVGAGAIYEVVRRVVPGTKSRFAIAGVLIVAVLLIWAQGAVGIF